MDLCQPAAGQRYGPTPNLIPSRTEYRLPAGTSSRTGIILRSGMRKKRSAIYGPGAGINPPVRKNRRRGGIRRTAGTEKPVAIETGGKTGQGQTGIECGIFGTVGRAMPMGRP